MPRIRCHYLNCVFLDEGYCSAPAVEIDPDEGCLTFSQEEGVEDQDDWVDEDDMLDDEWVDDDFEDDDLWLDEDEDDIDEDE